MSSSFSQPATLPSFGTTGASPAVAAPGEGQPARATATDSTGDGRLERSASPFPRPLRAHRELPRLEAASATESTGPSLPGAYHPPPIGCTFIPPDSVPPCCRLCRRRPLVHGPHGHLHQRPPCSPPRDPRRPRHPPTPALRRPPRGLPRPPPPNRLAQPRDLPAQGAPPVGRRPRSPRGGAGDRQGRHAEGRQGKRARVRHAPTTSACSRKHGSRKTSFAPWSRATASTTASARLAWPSARLSSASKDPAARGGAGPPHPLARAGRTPTWTSSSSTSGSPSPTPSSDSIPHSVMK